MLLRTPPSAFSCGLPPAPVSAGQGLAPPSAWPGLCYRHLPCFILSPPLSAGSTYHTSPPLPCPPGSASSGCCDHSPRTTSGSLLALTGHSRTLGHFRFLYGPWSVCFLSPTGLLSIFRAENAFQSPERSKSMVCTDIHPHTCSHTYTCMHSHAHMHALPHISTQIHNTNAHLHTHLLPAWKSTKPLLLYSIPLMVFP